MRDPYKTAQEVHVIAAQKFVPKATPETQRYWDGCAAGELWLQRCTACAQGTFFPPGPFCPSCLSSDIEWFRSAGHGRLHTYLISHRPAPGYQDEVPYAIAVVELDEGPRLMTNIVGIPNTPEDLVLDMELAVTFQDRGDVAVPVFGPKEAR